jgi:hypothetical protein
MIGADRSFFSALMWFINGNPHRRRPWQLPGCLIHARSPLLGGIQITWFIAQSCVSSGCASLSSLPASIQEYLNANRRETYRCDFSALGFDLRDRK